MNRRAKVPNDSTGRHLADGHQALASGNESGDRLLQICQRDRWLRDSENRSGGAKCDWIIQSGGYPGARNGIEQFGESTAHLQGRFARFARGPSGREFKAQSGRIAGLPRPPDKSRFQDPHFLEIIPQETFQILRCQRSFFGQRFEAERMGGCANGQRRIGQLEQFE